MLPPLVDSAPVAIVGFGLLGQAYGVRLSNAGREVLVVEPAKDLATRLAGTSHVPVSIDEAVNRAAVVVVSVYDAQQVRSVIDDCLRCCREGTTLLVSTTLHPVAAIELSALAITGEISFVEYPISGTSRQVAHGEGLGIVAPRQPMRPHVREVIDTLTPSWVQLDQIGTPAAAKLAINLVLEVTRSAVAQGVAFAEAVGLDPEALAMMLPQSAAASRVMKDKLPKLMQRDFTPEGRVEQSLKDCQMIAAVGRSHGLELPLLETQCAMLSRLVDAGCGDLDATAVIDVLGLKVRR